MWGGVNAKSSLKEIKPSYAFMTNAITFPYPENFFIQFLKENLIEPKSIVEVGGGKRFSLYGKFTQASYVNIDFSENTGVPTIIKNIVIDNFDDLAQSADIVYSNNTLEHIFDPSIAAQNMMKMLKPGGYLFIQAPFSYRYHPVPNDYWRFSPDGLAALFSSLKCIQKGFNIHNRRVNDIGSFKNKLDAVPIDEMGGWRERWFAYFIGQKI